ncbi:MAG TPA: P1 family peptidase [Candidatus Limnocylindria bacterium]|nr:P1 family peptidase [Candidatus Limnocylindria bacterium]
MTRPTNDTVHPNAVTEIDAKRWLDVDFPGLEFGVAEYAEGPTGCTVFSFGRLVSLHADVRGGSVGVIGEGLPVVNAICFAGGSQYGLEAATGVGAELFARKGFSTQWNDIQLVAGAIIFDYGGRENAIYPDKELGRAAVRALRPGRLPLGPHGAGSLAKAGHGETAEIAGQGGAARKVGATRLAVFTVINAYGAILDRHGNVVRGNRDTVTGKRRRSEDVVAEEGAYYPPAARGRAVTQNTNLTLMVTDQKLDALQLRSVARQVHSSLARAIHPFNTRWDGDVLFAVSTQTVDDPALDEVSLGVVASEIAWDAALASFDP